MRQQCLIVLVVVFVCISVEVVVNLTHARKHRKGNADSIVIATLPTLQALNCTPSLGGSSLTWTQCYPCSLAGSGSCYKQVNPIFDPSASSSYSKVSCSSNACLSFLSDPLCLVSADSCVYNITYLDESFTAGFLATETLSLTPTNALTGFYFGCGEQNEGLFEGIAGILGLDMRGLSIVSQASSMYGNYFSYCMPELFSNSTGHLTLGKGGTTLTSINYTPLITNILLPNAYFLELTSIWVAGNDLNISPVVFSDPGTIINSGTTLTYLPPEAYSALLDAFTEFMDAQNYPSIPSPYKSIEACYNLTGIAGAVVPTIKLFFNGGAQMNMHTWGIVFWIPNFDRRLEVCLAFASNGGTSGLSILGNLQQETFDIVYDIDGGRIGFGANGCSVLNEARLQER